MGNTSFKILIIMVINGYVYYVLFAIPIECKTHKGMLLLAIHSLAPNGAWLMAGALLASS